MAVTAVVEGVLKTLGAGVVVQGLTGIVSYIINDRIPKVWYAEFVYRKWRKWPDTFLREIIAERCSTYHFSDSARTNYIGKTESEHWL